MKNIETMETHSQPCDDNAKHSQPKHHSVLLVKTTSDATLDDARIGLTQEQSEERIGSEKAPR